MRKMMIAAAAALATVSTAAVAAWNIDSTGHGFVGKGDVQLALNLNNAQLQARANSLAFTYEDTADAVVYCEKDFDGNKQKAAYTEYKDYKRTQSVSAMVAYDARTKKQVTGFNLNGFSGVPTITGEAAVCPGGWEADPEGAALAGAEPGSNVVYVDGTGDSTLKVDGVALTVPVIVAI